MDWMLVIKAVGALSLIGVALGGAARHRRAEVPRGGRSDASRRSSRRCPARTAAPAATRRASRPPRRIAAERVAGRRVRRGRPGGRGRGRRGDRRRGRVEVAASSRAGTAAAARTRAERSTYSGVRLVQRRRQARRRRPRLPGGLLRATATASRRVRSTRSHGRARPAGHRSRRSAPDAASASRVPARHSRPARARPRRRAPSPCAARRTTSRQGAQELLHDVLHRLQEVREGVPVRRHPRHRHARRGRLRRSAPRCGACVEVCPQNCIDVTGRRAHAAADSSTARARTSRASCRGVDRRGRSSPPADAGERRRDPRRPHL